MTPPARLFIVELDLAELSSHFFNQILGFKQAAEQLGLTPHVFLPSQINPSLAEALGGRAMIDLDVDQRKQLDFPLDVFAEADRLLRPLWRAIEEMAVSNSDIIVITSARPTVIYSLGAWLGNLAPERRPAVFIRFLDHSYLNPGTMDYSDHSWQYRFASRDLSLRAGQERVFFTTNNDTLVTPLSGLCLRRVFHMPLPKYYGELAHPPADRRFTAIYVHLNRRSGAMVEQIEPTLHQILDRFPDLRIRLKYCLNALNGGKAATLGPDLAGRGVELIASEQSHADYIRTIAHSDIVLLPHESSEYELIASGVFAESAALGKVIVYPGNTWMADQVAKGHATGVSFDGLAQANVCAAVFEAVERLPELANSATQQSKAFRQQNSCLRNLELMQAIAAELQDMRPTYPVGDIIDFSKAAQSRGYMTAGWSETESLGVWTEGPEAMLCFRCDPIPSGALDVQVRLSPLLVENRTAEIELSVNEVKLRTWSFGRGDHGVACRRFTIPPDILADGVVNMLLKISNPVSLKQLGISEDSRLLGVMLHEMRIEQTASGSEKAAMAK
jgi:hypothetical protein